MQVRSARTRWSPVRPDGAGSSRYTQQEATPPQIRRPHDSTRGDGGRIARLPRPHLPPRGHLAARTHHRLSRLQTNRRAADHRDIESARGDESLNVPRVAGDFRRTRHNLSPVWCVLGQDSL